MWRLLLVTALVCAPGASAKKAKARAPAPPVAPEPVEAAPDPPAPAPTPELDLPLDAPTAELLAHARELYDGLEYDRVIPYAEAVLARGDADVEKRLDAYLLHGSALAIVGNPIDAETPFRFLLRGRPDFDMAADTPPKILAVFRKVQVEERAIRDQLRELERAQIVKSIALDAVLPETATGGVPLDVELDITDPRGAVKSARAYYRRRGEPAYSALALTRSQNTFTGSIPGEWTENEGGVTVELWIAALDADDQPLSSVATSQAPRTIAVAPGTVDGAEPFYQSVWFWSLGAGAGVALVTTAAVSLGTVLYIVNLPPPSDLGPVYIE